MKNEETRANKMYAILLIILGIIAMKIDGDATASIIMFMIASILLAAKKNVIN